MSDHDPTRPEVIGVTVQNWPDKWAKTPEIKKSSFQTYTLDPAVKTNSFVEICAYEPGRYRVVVEPIDAPVVLYLEQPKTSPEAVAGIGTPYSNGRYLATLQGDSAGQVVSNPAVGAEDVITVPAGETWRLDNILLRLVTSAAVANRTVILIIDDGNPANVIFTSQANGNQTAGQTTDYIFGAGLPERAGIGGIEQHGVPPLMLKGGYRIRTLTTGKDAGDQYGPDIVNYTKVGTVGNNGIGVYEFFGPDAMWVNTITGAPTRVGVTKEYC